MKQLFLWVDFIGKSTHKNPSSFRLPLGRTLRRRDPAGISLSRLYFDQLTGFRTQPDDTVASDAPRSVLWSLALLSHQNFYPGKRSQLAFFQRGNWEKRLLFFGKHQLPILEGLEEPLRTGFVSAPWIICNPANVVGRSQIRQTISWIVNSWNIWKRWNHRD